LLSIPLAAGKPWLSTVSSEIVRKLIRRFSLLPKWQVVSLGLFLILVLSILDYQTGEFSLAILYLVPVFIGAWFVPGRLALLFPLLASASILATHGSLARLQLHSAHLWNNVVEAGFLLLTHYLLCVLKKELELEKVLARTDELTGVLNRRSFIELAEYELRQSQRYQRMLTVVYIDLDNFKTVNDTLGHHVGDELLRTVAEALRKTNRNTDLIARLGGDEFCVLYPQSRPETVKPMLARMQEALILVMDGKGWPVTFSIGAVTFLSPPGSVEEMLREADARMYAVKHGGKNMISHAAVEPLAA
jgi:diguanylate cyclase (GGDEF)-like protein